MYSRYPENGNSSQCAVGTRIVYSWPIHIVAGKSAHSSSSLCIVAVALECCRGSFVPVKMIAER